MKGSRKGAFFICDSPKEGHHLAKNAAPVNDWRLLHTTRYRFDHQVALGPHEIRLRPSGPLAGDVSEYRLRIWPAPSIAQWRLDLWNNHVFQAWFSSPVTELTVSNQFRFHPGSANPFDFALESSAVDYPIELDAALSSNLAPYLELSESACWVEPWTAYQGTSITLLLELNRWINENIAYEARAEAGIQSCSQTLTSRRGSCRDTAWLLALGLRKLGYPTRFVSGYWLQVDSGAGELHAWTEVYLPGAGWLGLDPTAGLLVSNQHLPVARSPLPDQTAPIRGSHDGSPSQPEFRVRVRRC